jgi:hypothetical protein
VVVRRLNLGATNHREMWVVGCGARLDETRMTHQEFLIWLKQHLESASATGLEREGVRAIREELARMRKAGSLQPFASRLLSLVRERSTIDAATVASFVRELRFELAPPRERTVVWSATSDSKTRT